MSISYDYYPAILHAINLLGQGNTLTVACDQARVSIPMYKQYVEADPHLKALHDDAEVRGNDALADALINIDNHKIHGHSDSRMAKVISDNIKWVLAKRDSKRFGDKIEVQHNVTLDKTITMALDAAKRRANPALPPPDIEDAVIVEDDAEILRQLLG